MNIRLIFTVLLLWPIGLVAYALYMQQVEFLDPCPLCILQRVAYLVAALFAVPAVLARPGPVLQKTLAAGYALAALVGAGIAAWHVRLQHLPPDQVPDCGPGLDYMLENLPLWSVMQEVFQGSGECADIVWTFLGLSMPAWSLVMFALMFMAAVWTWKQANKAR